MTDTQAIKDFFTEEEWDAIYDALNEYQDHGEEEADLVDSIHSKLHILFA